MMEKRIHVIPLRRETVKVGAWRRSPKAIRALRDYVLKHYRTGNVKVGKYLNERIWERSGRYPPAKVKVVAVKGDDKVFLELEDKYEEPKVDKKDEKPVVAEKGADDKKVEEKKVEVKEEKKEVKEKAPAKKKSAPKKVEKK